MRTITITIFVACLSLWAIAEANAHSGGGGGAAGGGGGAAAGGGGAAAGGGGGGAAAGGGGGTNSGYNARTMADYSCWHGVFGQDYCGPWVAASYGCDVRPIRYHRHHGYAR